MNEKTERELQRKVEERGLARRTEDYVRILSSTGNRRVATAAYCAGNRWLTENARAVGNL